MEIIRGESESFWDAWDALRGAAEVSSALYTRLDLEYMLKYPQPWEATDLSFILTENNKPVAGVLAALKRHEDGTLEISAYGRPTLYVEDQRLARQHQRSLNQALKTELTNMSKKHPGAWYYHQTLNGTLDPMGKYLLDAGAQSSSIFAQVIDLRLEERVLHQQLRGSYKQCINWGVDHLSPRVLDHTNVNPEDFESYRQLHIAASERETRSKVTWDLNYRMIAERQAFLVLGTRENRLVSGAYCNYSGRHCCYSNSASDRSQYDKPLAHALIWLAMAHARKLGCESFEVGHLMFPGQPIFAGVIAWAGGDRVRIPSEKEDGITNFKRGFGGETITRLDIYLRR